MIDYAKTNDYCKVTLPNDKNNILQYQSGTKALKMPHIMIADTADTADTAVIADT